MHHTHKYSELNHSVSLAKGLSVRLQNKWLWVRVSLQSLTYKVGCFSVSKTLEKPKNHVSRKSIVWKLARGYFLCYCLTFSLVPNPKKCEKRFFIDDCSTLFVLYKIQPLKSSNIAGQRKTTGMEKQFYP